MILLCHPKLAEKKSLTNLPIHKKKKKTCRDLFVSLRRSFGKRHSRRARFAIWNRGVFDNNRSFVRQVADDVSRVAESRGGIEERISVWCRYTHRANNAFRPGLFFGLIVFHVAFFRRRLVTSACLRVFPACTRLLTGGRYV